MWLCHKHSRKLNNRCRSGVSRRPGSIGVTPYKGQYVALSTSTRSAERQRPGFEIAETKIPARAPTSRTQLGLPFSAALRT